MWQFSDMTEVTQISPFYVAWYRWKCSMAWEVMIWEIKLGKRWKLKWLKDGACDPEEDFPSCLQKETRLCQSNASCLFGTAESQCDGRGVGRSESSPTWDTELLRSKEQRTNKLLGLIIILGVDPSYFIPWFLWETKGNKSHTKKGENIPNSGIQKRTIQW